MQTKKSLLIMVFVFVSNIIFAQTAPDTLWTKTFGGAGRDQALTIVEIPHIGYVVAGVTSSFGNGIMDVWLIKIDDNGNEIWNKTYGGANDDFAASVQRTSDNGFVIAGSTKSFGNGGRDVWLIKTDENGNEIWNKFYGGTNNDLAQYVQQTIDNGFIITGSTESFGNGGEDIWLLKVNENGDLLWDKTFGGPSGERAYTVYQTIDNGYILAGRTESYGNGNLDAWLIKTDTSGNELWNKTFGGTEADNAYSLQLTNDNGYILAGFTKSSGNGEEDIWLIRTNEYGDEIWNKKFGGARNDITYSVNQTSDSGYIITGFTNSSGNGEMDVWFLKTNINGNLIWDKTCGGFLNDLAFAGHQTSDGGYISVGSTYSYGNGQDDFYIIKLKSNGTSAIKNALNEKPRNFILMQNYPNPFNPTTKIRYKIPKLSFVTLKIYDFLGKEVATLVNEKKSMGKFEVEFNASKLSSGVYYYRISSQNFSETKKLILLK